MKTNILFVLSLFPAVAIAGADEKPAAQAQTQAQAQFSGSGIAVETSSDGKGTSGKAIITTTDSTGKQHTQVVDLKDGENNVFNSYGSGGGGKMKLLRGPNEISMIGGGVGVSSGPVTWFGIASDAVSEEISAQLPIEKGVGLIVRHLVPESPAQRAGLAVNDVLYKFDEQLLVNSDQLRVLVRTKKAGDAIKLTYFRKGQQSEAQVKLEQKDIAEADAAATPPTINLGPGRVKVDQLIKGLDNVPAPLAIHKKIVVTSPDGKILSVTEEGKSGSEDVSSPAEAIQKTIDIMRKNGANLEAIKALEKALQDATSGGKRDTPGPKAEGGAPKASN